MTPLAETRLRVPADHPCLPGHFPGRPVVPGVLLLDLALSALEAAGHPRPTRLLSAKFTRPVRPEEEVSLLWREAAPDRLAFSGRVGEALAFSGEAAP